VVIGLEGEFKSCYFSSKNKVEKSYFNRIKVEGTHIGVGLFCGERFGEVQGLENTL